MSVTNAASNNVKNNTGTHGGERLGFTLGGGWRGLLLDRLFGISDPNSSRFSVARRSSRYLGDTG
jgi:hypothetical protein